METVNHANCKYLHWCFTNHNWHSPCPKPVTIGKKQETRAVRWHSILFCLCYDTCGVLWCCSTTDVSKLVALVADEVHVSRCCDPHPIYVPFVQGEEFVRFHKLGCPCCWEVKVRLQANRTLRNVLFSITLNSYPSTLWQDVAREIIINLTRLPSVPSIMIKVSSFAAGVGAVAYLQGWARSQRSC